MGARIPIPHDAIADFCRRRGIKEMSLFGSALTDDFRPDSDVDVLVVLQENVSWSLFDHLKAEEELAELFGRDVDLVMKKAVRNPFIRHHILNHQEVIYAS